MLTWFYCSPTLSWYTLLLSLYHNIINKITHSEGIHILQNGYIADSWFDLFIQGSNFQVGPSQQEWAQINQNVM